MRQSKLKNLVDMEKDILSHPEDDLSYISSLCRTLTKEEIDDIYSALNVLLQDEGLSQQEKTDMLENSWKLNYKYKPPTPEEFLTDKWIGPQANDMFPHCTNVIKNYFNPLINKNKLILYCCTG